MKKYLSAFLAALLIISPLVFNKANAATNLVDATPTMTGNTTPAPNIVSASSTYSTYYPYKAFDKVLNQSDSYWISNAQTGWISYNFGAGNKKVIQSYSLTSKVNGTAGDYASQSPKTWTLEGSNDGSTWTVLDSRSYTTIPWTTYGQTLNWSINNSTAYQIYRVNISSNFGSSVISIEEVQLFEVPVPTAPSSFFAEFGDANVKLSWAQSTDAVSYNIYRNGSLLTNTTATSYTDTTVTNGTQYSYFVRAVNSSGNESADSNTITGTPLPPKPPAPTNIGASVYGSSVTITWTLESQADSYNVYKNGVKVNTSPITTNSFQVTNLPDGNVSFTVSAVNLAGESDQSTPVRVYVDITPPSIPTNLQGTGQFDSVVLTWSNPPQADFKGVNVYVNGSKVTSAAVSGTTYTVKNLTAGNSYNFQVSSVDNTGNESALSAPISVTVPTVTVLAPTNVNIDSSGNMTWTNPATNPDGTVYTVYQNGQPIGTTTGATYTIQNYSSNSNYSVTAQYGGYSTNPVQVGGTLQADSSKWGFTAGDIFTNSLSLTQSVAGFLLLMLVILFAPDIRRVIISAFQKGRERIK